MGVSLNYPSNLIVIPLLFGFTKVVQFHSSPTGRSVLPLVAQSFISSSNSFLLHIVLTIPASHFIVFVQLLRRI